MKFDINLIAKLAAVAAAAYGGYELYLGPETQIEQLKFIVLTACGVLYTVYDNLDLMKGLVARKSPSARVFTPEDFEERDFQCLVHLRNRLTEAGSTDGIETCELLNTIVFSLHAKEKLNQLKKVKDV